MTAVEWLVEQMFINNYINKKQIENANTWLIAEAKELEKEQLEKIWKAAEQNMRSQFSSSAYKNVTFDEYYKQQIR